MRTWHWHVWTGWEDVATAASRGYLLQQRRCKKCNKAKTRAAFY